MNHVTNNEFFGKKIIRHNLTTGIIYYRRKAKKKCKRKQFEIESQ